jgi:type II secretory pathway pseudopilin PulG
VTELLVVIGVISVLAALLFPSLAKARQKARLTHCQSNLRQISLGLLQYADVNASYPYYLMVVAAPDSFITWDDALVWYTAARWTNGLFQCPNYNKRTVPGNYSSGKWNDPEGSYGYNQIGTGELPAELGFFPSHLGLGGLATKPGDPGEGARKESTVTMPSEMALVGDGAAGQLGRPSALPAGYNRFLHGTFLNVAFCDQHVETVAGSKLFERSDEARRKFNYDHNPHPETWPDMP